MKPVYVVGFSRTPIGSFQGALSSVKAVDLGAAAIKGALEKSGVKPDQVGEVLMGQVLQGGTGQAPGRQASLAAGIPSSVPATTVNKVCGSGMKTIIQGVQSILLGDNDIVVAGGMESMSQAPYALPQGRNGFRMGNASVVDLMLHDGLWDPYNNQHMGMCGELCAKERKFTREAQDEFAIRSFKRAIHAQKEGWFKDEITPFVIASKKGNVTIDQDEGPSKVQFDKISTLKPVFDPKGTITAANASSINDGAAAMVLASEEAVNKYGLKPLAKIVSYGAFAQDPLWFTTAPAEGMRRALKKAGWSVDQLDHVEVNEAFAVVAMSAQEDLKIPDEKINPVGSGISLGHPIGASGCRIVITMISSLIRNKQKRGLAGICIGGGESLALTVEIV